MQVFQIDIFQGEQGRFLDPQAVVVDKRKQGAITWRRDHGKKAFHLFLGKGAGERGLLERQVFGSWFDQVVFFYGPFNMQELTKVCKVCP